MSAEPAIWAILPAAGYGRRMGAALPKQYLELNGKTLLEHTLQRILAYPGVRAVVLVVAADDRSWEPVVAGITDRRIEIASGGAERCHSVLNGLMTLHDRAAENDWVLVHDAARPCVRHSDLDRLFSAIHDDPAGGLLGVPVRDTMKRTDSGFHVVETVERERLWHALTPQVFRQRLLREALEQALADGIAVTDEAAAVERAGFRPLMVEGRSDNIKVTRPEDLDLAAFFLRRQEVE